MSITLWTITLPPGLRWTDEYAWSAAATTVNYSVTGAIIVQKATRQAGRPITLTGGASFAWATKTQLDALTSALIACTDSGLTLTLHDGRSFTVIPAPTSGDSGVLTSATGAIDVAPLPVVADSGPANPSADTLYALNSLKFIEV